MPNLAEQKINKQLIGLIQDNSSEWLEQVPAVLGDLSGNLDAGFGNVYARLYNGQVVTAINRVAPMIFNLQVIIGRSKSLAGIWQVISIRETYVNPATNLIPYHHEQHEFPASDTVWVNRKQITTLTILVTDAAAFKVTVYGGIIHTANGIQIINNTPLDLSSYVLTAGAKYISIESDDDGTITVHDGTTVDSKEALTETDIPSPDVGQYFLGCVMLYESQAELSNDDIRIPLSVSFSAADLGFLIHSSATLTTLINADEFGLWHSGEAAHISYENLLLELADALVPGTRWVPLANGDPADPSLIFDAYGNVIMVIEDL